MVTLQNDNVKEVRTRAECLLEKSMFRLQKVRIYKDLARLDIKQGELQYAKVRLNYVAEYGNTFLQPKRQSVFRENSAGSWNQIGGHSVKYMTINGTAERGKVRKNMKRLVAALIDFYLCGFILMFFIIIISVVTKSPISWFLVLFIFCYFFYTFIFNYFFQGNTFGKKCMKIEYIISTSKQKRMKYSVLHGLFKSLRTIIWPICIFFYFILGFNMPYDKILKKYWE